MTLRCFILLYLESEIGPHAKTSNEIPNLFLFLDLTSMTQVFAFNWHCLFINFRRYQHVKCHEAIQTRIDYEVAFFCFISTFIIKLYFLTN